MRIQDYSKVISNSDHRKNISIEKHQLDVSK